MVRLFTIGFAGKTAEKFFGLLLQNGVRKIIDTRLHPGSQLSGFAKAKDLEFFARKIGNITYEHRADFAPTDEILSKYRNKAISWEQYERDYLQIIANRNIDYTIHPDQLHQACLLCSEDDPKFCHRRLLAEYLAGRCREILVVHLR